ncbi:MAG: transposase, partial [Burkholderiales bacterium]|nr:transposase [Burkholderiales bacterium]
MSSVRKILRDDQWQKLAPLLPGKAGDKGRSGQDNRLLIEAVLWIVRTSSPWRDLPAELGNW